MLQECDFISAQCFSMWRSLLQAAARHLFHFSYISRRVIKLTYGLIMTHDNRIQHMCRHTYTHCTVEQAQTDTHFLLCSRDGSTASAGYLPSLSDPYVQVQCYPSTSPTPRSLSGLLSPTQKRLCLSKQIPHVLTEILTRNHLIQLLLLYSDSTLRNSYTYPVNIVTYCLAAKS